MNPRPIPARASRRDFLRRAGAFSACGVAAPLALNLAALGSAGAQSATDYKALVCIFLYGGNDAFNMVLPTDGPSWSAYLAARDQRPDTIALRPPGTPAVATAGAGTPDRLGGVLPIAPTHAQGRSFALHPALGALRDLFDARRLAVVANVGPLLQPMSKAQYRDERSPRPAKLFSHNDQVSTWQAGAPEGATVGWGGRMGDLLASANARAVFTSISAASNAVWLSGREVTQYQVSPRGAIRIGGSGDTLFGSDVALRKLHAVMRNARSAHPLERDHAAVVGRSIDAEALLASALPAANAAPYGTPGLASGSADPLLQYADPLSGGRTTNPLAQQLQVVARMIGARIALGQRRQVFLVSLGNFDTHSGQNRTMTENMARLAHGLAYFDAALAALGVADSVTTFTASDFGRSFTSNGDGTDHGWGAHHFVHGGAVRGGDVYGRFPALGRDDGRGDFTSADQLGNGVLLPSVSIDQYAATLARWFGVSASQTLEVFPRLANFDASTRDLGFMG